MDLASIYLNDFTVKTNILHTTLVYVQKSNLKFFNAPFCLVVCSCLSIIAGLTIPFREKWNSKFKDTLRVFSSSLFGPTCFPKKQTFHIYSNKKENPHESPRESVDPQKQQCVTATSISFFRTWAGSKSKKGNCADAASDSTTHLIVLSWLPPCGNAWILSRMSRHDVKLVWLW